VKPKPRKFRNSFHVNGLNELNSRQERLQIDRLMLILEQIAVPPRDAVAIYACAAILHAVFSRQWACLAKIGTPCHFLVILPIALESSDLLAELIKRITPEDEVKRRLLCFKGGDDGTRSQIRSSRGFVPRAVATTR